jgi:hypothetical protein
MPVFIMIHTEHPQLNTALMVLPVVHFQRQQWLQAAVQLGI